MKNPLGPTLSLIRSVAWQFAYRLFLGKSYASRVEQATKVFSVVVESTNARISHFHDIRGERIRGWHKQIKFNPAYTQHPLVTKYSNK